MSSNPAPALASTPNVPVLQLFSLEGQTALVTGANRGKGGLHRPPIIDTPRLDSFYYADIYVLVRHNRTIGIGASIALALAQAGAHVILVHRSPSTATTTLDTIRSQGYPASVVYADLADKEQVKAVYASALEVLKTDTASQRTRIEILVHAAGIQRRAPAAEFKDDEWEEVINVNLSSAFYLAKSAAQHMLASKPSYGKIILLGSLLTFQGGLTVPAYAAAKGGIGQLTKALSNEWSKQNINVNCICPGYIKTEMNDGLLKDEVRLRQISERIPAGRWGEGADFAGPVVWLASAASKYVCGECIVVDGGWMGR